MFWHKICSKYKASDPRSLPVYQKKPCQGLSPNFELETGKTIVRWRRPLLKHSGPAEAVVAGKAAGPTPNFRGETAGLPRGREMKAKWLKISLILVICAFGLLSTSLSWAEEYAPDEILIKFKALQEDNSLQAFRAKVNATKIKKFQINGVYQMKLQQGTSVSSAIATAYTDPNVEYAEPNYVININTTPNDPSFGSLWGMNNTGQTGGTSDADIDAPEAWDIIREVPDNVIVAVIDTGVDYNHPDLANNIWVNSDEIPNNGIDDDGNGYIDDYRGYDFANNDNDPMDGHSHGTHVSGTIAAIGNNSIGVCGVAWRAKIMPVKFLSDSGSGYTSDAIEAVQYAVANGAKILSNSWGGGGYSQALKDAITASHNAGTLFVAAAGNSGTNNDSSPAYPASYDVDNIISVAATDHNDSLAYFSCYGPTSVDIAAPGVSVLSTTPNNTYSTYSGTSMATPHISGMCALIWAKYPELTNLQVKSKLLSTTDMKPSLIGKMVSNGRANLYKALTTEQDTTPPADITDLATTDATYKSVTLTWTAVGDDNLTGTAALYTMRYSTSPITGDNFNQALAVSGLSIPKESGTQETFTVQSLSPNTTYYFAIKVLDEWGNTSNISNIVSAKTGTASIIYQDKMENGLNGWTITGSDGNSGSALWHLSQHKFNSSTTSWYYGSEKTYTYDTGARNYGTITSSTINISAATSADLIFNYWRSVESYPYAYDTLKAEVSYNNGTTWQTLWTISSTMASEKTWTSSGYISLDAGTQIKIRFSFDTLDAIANAYEGVYIDDIEIVGIAPEDTTAPAQITDLSVAETGTTRVKLQWTAPGDDGNTGTALSYDIRYSTSNITSDNWGSATQATGEPNPKQAGSTESFTVTGLSSNTKYYFAIKAMDNNSNESELSNVVSTTTASPPHAVVTPTEMPSVTLMPNTTTTKTLTISNTGNSPLEFSLTDTKISGLAATTVQAAASDIEDNPYRGEITPNAEYANGEILVKFSQDTAIDTINTTSSEIGAEIAKEYKGIGAYRMKLNGNLSVADAIDLLKQNQHVIYAEPNYKAEAFTIPNDPRFSELYGLHNTGQTGGTADKDIDAPEAWGYWKGSEQMTVCVIDTGIDYTHEDLSANVWHNPNEIPNDGIDDDGNGYIDDYYGYDFANNDSNPYDDHSHGTHCSGTIGGVGNNGIGVAGINWTVKIMALKFLNSGGSGTYADAVEAIIYSADMGVKVSSNSWGGGGYSQALKDAIDYAKTKGQLFIAAAGNSGANSDVYPLYPAAYNCDNIISVAATDHNDALAYFSNYGAATVDIGAPGVSILSTLPGNSYGKYSGTSMATPHVAGSAALVWSQKPGLTYSQVKDKLLSSADACQALAGKSVSGGRLNVYNAIQKENDIIPPNPITDLAVTDSTFKSITLMWTAVGDDENTGAATMYDLRYSTSAITADNFSSATQVAGEPTPSPAGTTESVTISGLDYNTTYYFAIKAMDNVGNWGKISNVPSSATKAPTIVFQDNMEQDTSNWTAQSPWALTTETAHSGSACWTDSPNAEYGNNVTASLQSVTIDMTKFSTAALTFWHKYALEKDYDYGYLDISSNNGSTWTQVKSYTGTKSSWTKDTIDLSSYIGKSIQIRFRLVTDDSEIADGWYIDDVIILGSVKASGWLKPDITSGAIQANSSTTITITYDAVGVDLGSYSAELNVCTNDPDNNIITVPASLIVEATPPTSAPNITITQPANGAIVRTPQVTISGTIDYPYSTIKANGTPAVIRNTTFGVTITLTEGTNNISIVAVNSAGTTTQSLNVTLDTTKPDIAITHPHNGFKTRQRSISVSGTVSDANGIASVTVNNQNATAHTNTFRIDDIALNEGSNVITALATDIVGNARTTSVNVIRDTTPPIIKIISPSNSITMASGTTMVVGSVNESDSTVTINGLQASVNSSGSFSKVITLSRGANTINVTAVDSLGNTSTASLNVIYSAGPTISVSPSEMPTVTLREGQTTSQTLTISNTGDQDLVYTIGVGETVATSLSGLSAETNEPDPNSRTFRNGEIPPAPQLPDHNPNRLLVKFKSNITGIQAEGIHAMAGAEVVKTYSEIGVQKVNILSSMDLKEAMVIYRKSELVEYVEPDFIVKSFTTPNDTYFSSLWGLHNTGQDGGTEDADIDAPEAWSITTGSSNVIIAVIDTGVDYTHPDLAANIWTGASGEHGYDFCNDDSDPYDDNSHGTHVSGTIAGVGNNGIGVSGVNWTARIMAVKFLSAEGSGYNSDAVDGIIYAVNNGARVLSNSWGGGGYSDTLRDAIEYANSNNVLFVAAAGNEGSDNDIYPSYPASYDCSNIISVAAVDRSDNLAYFSCYGASSVDIGAPGVDILSTTPDNTYSTYSGTSMATPHVSGVAGLILSQNINLTDEQVKERVLAGAVRISALSGKCVTGGRLNANNSLEESGDTTPPAAISNLSVSSTTFQSVTLTWTAVGDDGYSGTASSYDVRYSTSVITADNFDSCTAASGMPSPKASGYTDTCTVTGLSETTKYYFAIKAVDNMSNKGSISNIAIAMTATGTAVFSDTMESGTGNWTMESPWGLTTDSYHSASHSMTDSPNGYYSNNATTSVTSIPIDLSQYNSVRLKFWHKYALETYYDFGYVYVSGDNGSTWTLLKTYNGFQTSWVQESVDLSAYCGMGKTNVKIRFMLVSDYSITYDGWYIDDVTIVGSSLGTSWLSLSPLTGTVSPGRSAAVTLYYNACVAVGDYTEYIYINSNDTTTPLVSVKATLTVQDSPTTTWYLPEGCTRGFDEYVLIMNPNSESVTVKITFMKDDGTTRVEYRTLPATSRDTVHVNDYVPDASVSTMVESMSNLPIIAERSMYWDSNGLRWSGGHESTGVTSLSTVWYLAEGCTDGFDEYVLIQNPNAQKANVTVTYMLPDGTTVVKYLSVNATGRYTIYVNNDVPNKSVSTKISSDMPVAVERAMYWNSGTSGYKSSEYRWIEGHDATGVTTPAAEWYLAEGSTNGFDEWILIMNPNSQPTPVTVTYMKENGTTVEKTIAMPATSRYTIYVNTDVPNTAGVSTYIRSDLPIIVERAMYWDAGGIEWAGGHLSQGTTSSGTTWSLAEGRTGGEFKFDEWILVQNPNYNTASVKVTYMMEGGSTREKYISVSATSRGSVHVNNDIPDGAFSAKIESNIPVIAERAMYWNTGTFERKGGHASTGVKD